MLLGYVKFCYVMLCQLILYYVMLCYIMLKNVMLCYAKWCYVMLSYVKLCDIINNMTCFLINVFKWSEVKALMQNAASRMLC